MKLLTRPAKLQKRPGLTWDGKSELEETLAGQMRLLCLPKPIREFQFAPPRRWRFDFAWEAEQIAVECQGGLHLQQGGHSSASGIERDCEKYGEAACRGWRVVPVTRRMIEDGRAVSLIERALRKGDTSALLTRPPVKTATWSDSRKHENDTANNSKNAKETQNIMAIDVKKYLPASSWLKAADLEEEELDSCIVTIEAATEETFPAQESRPAETKLAVKFEEFEKPLVCNKTNTRFLVETFDDDTDAWPGNKVKLFITMVNDPNKPGQRVKSLAIAEAPKPKTRPRPLAAVAAGDAQEAVNPFADE